MGSSVPNVPGLVEQVSPGSRVLLFGPTRYWSPSHGYLVDETREIVQNENPSALLGWANATFSPFNRRISTLVPIRPGWV